MSEIVVPKQYENISCQATRAELDSLKAELVRIKDEDQKIIDDGRAENVPVL